MVLSRLSCVYGVLSSERFSFTLLDMALSGSSWVYGILSSESFSFTLFGITLSLLVLQKRKTYVSHFYYRDMQFVFVIIPIKNNLE